MHNGYIKLHRKTLKSLVFQNSKLFQLWLYCLLKASYKPCEVLIGLQKITLEAGQFVFGRKVASVDLDQTENSIYRHLKMLESLKNIEVKSNNKFSIVTICNWETYQSQEIENQQQIDSKSTTNRQQIDTYKNDKNNKNDKEDKKNIKKKIPEWKNNFQIYLSDAVSEFKIRAEDKLWLEEQQAYYPGVDILLSMQKMFREFWGTEAGWQNKKKAKIETINWKSTIQKGLSFPSNKVWKPKNQSYTNRNCDYADLGASHV
jgi:hypothetical protein